MQLLVAPTISSSVADAVIRFHSGQAHPNRFRIRKLKRLGETTGVKYAMRSRRGAGTRSRLVSLALPYLVAEVDSRSELADRLASNLPSLKGVCEVLSCRHAELREEQRKELAEKLTTVLEAWAATDEAMSVDKGRVARLWEPWALLAIGDPREDSYRLERVNANALTTAGLVEGAPFLRVAFHEADRDHCFVYLPAMDMDEGPSPAVLEMLARVEPAKPLSGSGGRFSPRR